MFRCCCCLILCRYERPGSHHCHTELATSTIIHVRATKEWKKIIVLLPVKCRRNIWTGKWFCVINYNDIVPALASLEGLALVTLVASRRRTGLSDPLWWWQETALSGLKTKHCSLNKSCSIVLSLYCLLIKVLCHNFNVTWAVFFVKY